MITTPTLLEQCGMCGSCCIEDARDEMVPKLTPPNEPGNLRRKNVNRGFCCKRAAHLPLGVYIEAISSSLSEKRLQTVNLIID